MKNRNILIIVLLFSLIINIILIFSIFNAKTKSRESFLNQIYFGFTNISDAISNFEDNKDDAQLFQIYLLSNNLNNLFIYEKSLEPSFYYYEDNILNEISKLSYSLLNSNDLNEENDLINYNYNFKINNILTELENKNSNDANYKLSIKDISQILKKYLYIS